MRLTRIKRWTRRLRRRTPRLFLDLGELGHLVRPPGPHEQWPVESPSGWGPGPVAAA